MLYFQNPILIHQYKIYLEKNAIGKNLQIRGKKMHGLKNDPPISSICSANFFLTPPRGGGKKYTFFVYKKHKYKKQRAVFLKTLRNI